MKLDKVATAQKGIEEERSKTGNGTKEKLDEICSRAELSPRKYLRRFSQ
jgi:hypothetical protein